MFAGHKLWSSAFETFPYADVIEADLFNGCVFILRVLKQKRHQIPCLG